MARKFKTGKETGRVILLVDDNLEYLEATRLVLEREGHIVHVRESGQAALEFLTDHTVDLLLLDYFMPGMTGEEMLLELRKTNRDLQVILQTGYASENPPRELLQRLDIQGYFDKSEGPEKLLLWTDVGLKAAYSMQLLQKSRKGLEFILAATPELYKIQPLDDLLHGVLWQVSGLLGSANSFLAVVPPQDDNDKPVEGFLAMLEEGHSSVSIRAGVGKYTPGMKIDEAVIPDSRTLVQENLGKGNFFTGNGMTLVPLQVGELTVGFVYLEIVIAHPTDIELLKVFANQAAVAIHNSQLFEMATMDPLTGAFVRRFFNQWMQRTLKTALRSKKPVGLLMIDMDNMKPINDTAGHLAGDRALIALVKVLKESTRSSDIIGRFGGDEFTVLLPDTPAEGVLLVANRILEGIRARSVTWDGGTLSLKASVGIAVLDGMQSELDGVANTYWEELSDRMIDVADTSLYAAKHAGRDRLGELRRLSWPGVKG